MPLPGPTVVIESTADRINSWYECWRRSVADARSLFEAEYADAVYGVDFASAADQTNIQVFQPRESQLFQFDTREGKQRYDIPRDREFSGRVAECWIETNNIRYTLMSVTSADWTHLDYRLRGFPTYFMFDSGIHAIFLWPTPTAAYRVAFRDQARRDPNYVELARITQQNRQYLNIQPQLCSRQDETKSIALLKSWLTPFQLEQYEKTQTFEVVGSHSKKRYRITDGRFSYGVHELDAAGNPTKKYCFVPEGACASGDVMLAQKVMLEQDERRALKIANSQPTAASAW